MGNIITPHFSPVMNRKSKKYPFAEVAETLDIDNCKTVTPRLLKVSFAPRQNVINAILEYSRKK